MKKPGFIVCLLSLISCINDCEKCFIPQDFLFELVDGASGENLFAKGKIGPEELGVTNPLNHEMPLTFIFVSESNLNLIRIPPIGRKTKMVNLKFDISGQPLVDFYVDAERKKSSKRCIYT